MLAPFLLFALVTYASGHLCGSNERYVQSCITTEPTCRAWKPCRRLASSITGCFCKPGTVRDEKTGCCVDMRQCRCGQNEYRNSQGNCVLSSVISTGRKCPVGYELDNSGVCCVVCPRGTSRNKYGKCVSITQIKTCEQGEEFTECCPVVQATCAAPLISASLDPVECQAGCVCRAGLVRNAIGTCIPINACV